MRPTPIPADELPDLPKVVIGPPIGDDVTGDIRSVEAAIETRPGVVPIFRFRIVLDDGDLERLQAGEPFWLSLFTRQIPPWAIGWVEQ